ncbi:hypothetical protein E2C01_085452 [Portunus trituberculatus]|uniref:Uncharacterized protein n=1 Tax=Portunus trituberculatus TaxID=210409 RepID=A0A5B7JDN5_PORTR|nr:hypothetical protein [Portunus trituberculatus]
MKEMQIRSLHDTFNSCYQRHGDIKDVFPACITATRRAWGGKNAIFIAAIPRHLAVRGCTATQPEIHEPCHLAVTEGDAASTPAPQVQAGRELVC